MTSARCYNQYCSPHDSTYVVTSWSESTGLVLLMCQILVSALLLAAASKWKVLVHLLIPPEPHRSPNECNITFSTRPHCVVFRPSRLVLNAPSSLASRVGGDKCSTSRRLMTSPQPPACQPTARLSRDRCACAVTFNTRASWMFLFYSLVSCEQQNFRKNVYWDCKFACSQNVMICWSLNTFAICHQPNYMYMYILFEATV